MKRPPVDLGGLRNVCETGDVYVGFPSEGPRQIDPPTTCVAGEHSANKLFIVSPLSESSNTRNFITLGNDLSNQIFARQLYDAPVLFRV